MERNHVNEKNNKEKETSTNVFQLVVCFLFLIIIFTPGICQIAHIEVGEPLAGVSVLADKPIFSKEELLDGKWQSSMDSYFAENLPLRNVIIRTGNQFVFNAFRQSTNDNLLLGKNGNLYENEYINKEIQYYPPVTEEYVQTLVQKLNVLEEQLNKKNKQLFIFVTPSKADVYSEDIPDSYWNIYGVNEGVSSYEKFIKALSQSDLHYYDSIPDVKKMKEEGETGVFPKTGTHWTRVTGSRIAKNLVEHMEQSLGLELAEISIDVKKAKKPVAPDADIFATLNILQEPYDTYYKPKVSIVEEGKDIPRLFCRGGSFMGQSVAYLIQNGVLDKNSVYLENKILITDNYENVKVINEYHEIDLKEMLEQTDIVLLEVNDGAIEKMGFGFIEYILDNRILE